MFGRLVIFDLDGTLALNEHRQHFVEKPGKKDWESFFNACDLDEPNWPIIQTAQALRAWGADVRIWSGRPAKGEVYRKTVDWLMNVGLGNLPLKMRKEGDFRTDMVMKAEWLDVEDTLPYLIFDDRNAMVRVWRDRGLTVAQVAEGDF